MYNEEKPVIETLRKKITETNRVMELLTETIFTINIAYIYLLWKTKLLIYQQENLLTAKTTPAFT